MATATTDSNIKTFFNVFHTYRTPDKSMVDFYNKHAKGYDQALTSEGYSAITEHTPKALKYYLKQELNLNPDEAEILDIGCGSGLSGVGLKNSGFTKFDGVDGSKSMLKISEKLNLYRNLYEGMLTDTEKFDVIPDEKYDAMISVGCIAKNHIKIQNAIPEFLRVIKKGGLGVYTISPSACKVEAMQEHLKYLRDNNIEIVNIDKQFYGDTRESFGNYCHVYVVKKL